MRVSLVAVSDSALVLEAYAYVLEPAYEAFMEIQETLLLKFIDVVEMAGTGMAFPVLAPRTAPGTGKTARRGKKAGDRENKQNGLFDI